MYLEHFGLKELPFSITPDTSFFFNHPGHREATNVMLVALRSGEGFIKITGEVGTGKTLLCRRMLNLLTVDKHFVTAYIPNPYLTPSALNLVLAEELGIEVARNAGQNRILKLITEKLIELSTANKKVVLLIDESQAMPEQTLEALRLLTNLETEKQKLLHIVLFGQPELNEILQRPSVRQLRQRIAFSHELPHLDREGIEAYVTHRLTVAGYNGSALLQADAFHLLHKASRGVPRLINILTHKAMMLAYGQGMRTVSAAHMRASIKDTEDAQLDRDNNFYKMLGVVTTLLLGLGVYLGIAR
jgi:MSHA biogenesis protein MshM